MIRTILIEFVASDIMCLISEGFGEAKASQEILSSYIVSRWIFFELELKFLRVNSSAHVTSEGYAYITKWNYQWGQSWVRKSRGEINCVCFTRYSYACLGYPLIQLQSLRLRTYGILIWILFCSLLYKKTSSKFWFWFQPKKMNRIG